MSKHLSKFASYYHGVRTCTCTVCNIMFVASDINKDGVCKWCQYDTTLQEKKGGTYYASTKKKHRK